jgi:hypothetical protein
MPKDEFDFDDPLELNGVAFLTEEDTTGPMTECFIEEFMRLGYNHKQILALFRNPHYTGMNMVFQNRGEAFVRDNISEIFARWGRFVAWPEESPGEQNPPGSSAQHQEQSLPAAPTEEELDTTATDPMGGAAPKINY